MAECNYSGCKRRAKDFEWIATVEPTGLPDGAQDTERLGAGLRAEAAADLELDLYRAHGALGVIVVCALQGTVDPSVEIRPG